MTRGPRASAAGDGHAHERAGWAALRCWAAEGELGFGGRGEGGGLLWGWAEKGGRLWRLSSFFF
jgi:hypothetical protein